jgi:uncharacterized protein (DUF1499 family)
MGDTERIQDSVAGIAAATAVSVCFALLLVEAGAALGSRAGWWEFRVGFTMLRTAAYLGLGSAAVASFALVSSLRGQSERGTALSAAAIVLGILAFAIPGSFLWTARHVPMIHDISTDTQDPPRFVALLEARRQAPNGADYGGPEVAAKQLAAYPDIRPVEIELAPAAAFERALATARRLGWAVAAADAGAGRIEATDTTAWFGFKDDVVIRVAPGPGGKGSRVDLRSVSRVGKSDIGKNASRIRTFVRAFGSG